MQTRRANVLAKHGKAHPDDTKAEIQHSRLWPKNLTGAIERANERGKTTELSFRKMLH
jgi:hypothetical protein